MQTLCLVLLVFSWSNCNSYLCFFWTWKFVSARLFSCVNYEYSISDLPFPLYLQQHASSHTRISNHWQGRMILAHLCDEPKGLKTGMCMVQTSLQTCGFVSLLFSLSKILHVMHLGIKNQSVLLDIDRTNQSNPYQYTSTKSVQTNIYVCVYIHTDTHIYIYISRCINIVLVACWYISILKTLDTLHSIIQICQS